MDIDIKTMEPVCDGIVRRNEKTYYIQCCIMKTWHYCNDVRLKKLIAKFGTKEDVGEQYISREGKRSQKHVAIKRKMPEIVREKYESQKAFIERKSRARQTAEKELYKETSGAVVYTYLPKPPADLSNISLHNSQIAMSRRETYPIFSEEGTKCIRKDIIQKNEGYCNNCPWWLYCKMELREWKKYEEQRPRTDKLSSENFQTTKLIYDMATE